MRMIKPDTPCAVPMSVSRKIINISRAENWPLRCTSALYCIGSSRGPSMTTVLQDLRYSLRQLTKTPGFALTAIISLALGIGATTAVFSVVYAILINPYPYANSDSMMHLRATLSGGQDDG